MKGEDNGLEPVGTKHDKDKVDPTLLTIDLGAQRKSIMHVLQHGADEHGARNWQNPPLDDDRRWAAAQERHNIAVNAGEWLDNGKDGTGEPHLACVIVNCLFRMWHHDQKEGSK